MRGAGAHVPLILLGVLLTVACGPGVDLTKGLQVEVVSTGWSDAANQDGLTKLVPTIALRLKNVSNEKLVALQVNAVFRRVNNPDKWDDVFRIAVGSEGLAPGRDTAPLTFASQLGYTGVESRTDMLQNTHFVDAKVDVFAKYGSGQWTRLGEYPIVRQLIQR
jgi:hypothetical protein